MITAVSIHRILGSLALPVFLALSVGQALASPAASPAAVQSPRQLAPQKPLNPPPTLVERLRRLLNIAPPVAVGGSRSGTRQSVCLLSPWIRSAPAAAETPVAEVLTAEPTLLSSNALSEVRLLDQGTVIWRQRTSSNQPIEGPIRWPLAPLRGGERLRLVLRP
ncbi:MAG: hypothetical protein VKI83_08785, partial [Synechococcaceae cyanobacterium]|nr:hypothetical protein [Synechococcaceae cyanobacterium]